MRRLMFCCAALFAGLVCAAGEGKCTEVADFLKMNQDRKQITSSGPYDLGVMLSPYRDGYLWKTPKERTSAIISLGTVPVKSLHRYSLRWEVLQPQFVKMHIRVAYIDNDGKPMMRYSLGTYENSSAFVKTERNIFTPPGVKAAQFELVLFNSKIVETTDRVLGFWKSMKLYDLGPQPRKEALKDHYGKNLLPFGDFSGFEVGEKQLSKFRVTPLGPKPYKAEVVERDGKKVLKVNYTPGDFQYIAWDTPKLPYFGSGAEIRCKIRGKGRVQLMVWYNRPTFATVFHHYGFFELTPEWKEYRAVFGCDDPLTQKVLFSFACRDNPAEFEVAELSLVFPDPAK